MTAIALFDFDGTITTKDSLFDFAKYAVGKYRFYKGILSISPSLIKFKLGFISSTSAKETFFKCFFGRWDEKSIKEMAMVYSRTRIPLIVRKSAQEKINWHKAQGHTVVIVSASGKHWLEEWCNQQQIGLLCTELEVRNKKITGKLLNKNCNGKEKVFRIRERYALHEFDFVYAYGDTTGDKEMLSIANKSFYRHFN